MQPKDPNEDFFGKLYFRKKDAVRLKPMDITQIIQTLTERRDQIDVAIASLDRLSGSVKRGPGRPAADGRKPMKIRKKRVVSEETRKKMAESQRLRRMKELGQS